MRTGALIFVSALAIYALSLNGVWAADHPTSFLQLDYSMWTRHSFILDGIENFKQHSSVDNFLYDGHYYSALAPGLPVLALPFTGLGFTLDNGFNPFGSAMFLSEFFIALTNAIASYLVYKIAKGHFNEKTSTLLAFGYAFATISWPFTTYFFQSDTSAMLNLFTVYFALKGKPVFSGVAAGTAFTVDYVNAVLIPVILVYFLATRGRRALSFLIPTSMGLFLIGAYNATIFGNPLASSEQVYQHTPSIFTKFSYPLLNGLALNLISPERGLLIYCPILLLGLLGFRIALRRRGYRKQAILFFACFLAVLIPYSMWVDPMGGESFGPRFLISAIPFILIPAGFIIEEVSQTWFLALYAVGVGINGIGAMTKAIPQPSNFPFLDQTIPAFLRGELNAWWNGIFGQQYSIVTTIILISTTVLLPIWVNQRSSKPSRLAARADPMPEEVVYPIPAVSHVFPHLSLPQLQVPAPIRDSAVPSFLIRQHIPMGVRSSQQTQGRAYPVLLHVRVRWWEQPSSSCTPVQWFTMARQIALSAVHARLFVMFRKKVVAVDRKVELEPKIACGDALRNVSV